MDSHSGQVRASLSRRRSPSVAFAVLVFVCSLPFLWSWISTAAREPQAWLDFRELEIMMIVVGGIIFTSCLIAIALSCHRRSWAVFAVPATVLTLSTFILGVLVDEFESFAWYEHVFGAFSTLSVGFAYSSLLLIPVVSARYARVQRLAVSVTVLATFYLATVVVFEVLPDGIVLYIGASLGTLASCGGLALALLVLAEQLQRCAADRGETRRMAISCPGCGFADVVEVGRIECSSCGLTLRIDVETGT